MAREGLCKKWTLKLRPKFDEKEQEESRVAGKTFQKLPRWRERTSKVTTHTMILIWGRICDM